MAVIEYKSKTEPRLNAERKREEILFTANLGPYDKNIFTLQAVADEVASQTGLSINRERVRQVLESFGADNLFYGRVERVKSLKKEQLGSILGIVYVSMLERAEREQGWPYMKALEYTHNHIQRLNSPPFDKLILLFSHYESAKKAGKVISLHGFEDLAGISFSYVARIFKKVGLKPMNIAFSKPKRLSKETEEAIYRGFYLEEFSQKDVAHFLSISQPRISERWKKLEKEEGKTKKKSSHIIRVNLMGSNITQALTNSLASQLYEYRDAGVSNSEIVKLFDLELFLLNHATKHRPTIAPRITEALRMLYPDKKVTKPYITWGQNK